MREQATSGGPLQDQKLYSAAAKKDMDTVMGMQDDMLAMQEDHVLHGCAS